jgi:hypothetical protein
MSFPFTSTALTFIFLFRSSFIPEISMAQIVCFILSNTLLAPIILTLGGLNWGSSAKEKPFSGIPIKLYSTSTSLVKILSTSTFISEGIILVICLYFSGL